MNRNRHLPLHTDIKDYGSDPLVFNMNCLAKRNTNYRAALWTGTHLQVTLMSIPVGEDIGIEMHDNSDQFIRIESGCALVQIVSHKQHLNEQKRINSNYAILIPACTWHNIINIGCVPLKLYSIYAPPQHPYGTIQKTKEDAAEE